MDTRLGTGKFVGADTSVRCSGLQRCKRMDANFGACGHVFHGLPNTALEEAEGRRGNIAHFVMRRICEANEHIDPSEFEELRRSQERQRQRPPCREEQTQATRAEYAWSERAQPAPRSFVAAIASAKLSCRRTARPAALSDVPKGCQRERDPRADIDGVIDDGAVFNI